MREQWIYLAGTLIVVDLIVVVAGAVPYLFGIRIGYGWRKILWMLLAVRLLIPVRMVMSHVYEEKPSYFVQVDAPAVYGVRERFGETMHGMTQRIEESWLSGQGLQDQRKETVPYQTDQAEALPVQDAMRDTAAAGTIDQGVKRDTDSGWGLLTIWVFGAFALTVYHVIGFLRIREMIKMHSCCCTDLRMNDQVKKLCEEYQMSGVLQIFICDQISSPMLFGYVHTRLLIPGKTYTEKELYLILRHELQHKKSGDLWYKLLIMLVCDIYWFNPAMILMKKLAYQDVECVCDTRVMRCLTAEEKKLYGNIVLDNMAGGRERVIVYGTSIFTGKRAAKLRIKNMFTKKNQIGFIVLGVLVLCAAAGSSMWVLSGQDREEQTVQADGTGVSDQDSDNVLHGIKQDTAVQSDTGQGAAVVYNTVLVEDMEDISRAKDLNCANCYTTNVVRGGNHYWIDDEGTLWGTGTSEYGQLKEVREDLSRITEPVEIAHHVKHVDYSGEYFVIYLTEDNRLYGLGANPSSVLKVFTMEDSQHIIPEPVLIMENVVYAKCGYTAVMILTENGEAHMRGELNDVPYSGRTSAKVMDHAKYVTSYNNTFAVIDDNDSLWTWGDNRLGQCGAGYFSEQVQEPQKVMDHVECAWMGRAAFNNTGDTDVRSWDNLIVLAKDGTFYGCGEGIGTGRMISGINDLDEAQEVIASDKLLPVSIQVYVPPVLPSLREAELLWTEDTLRQFLDRYDIDYTVGYTEEEHYLIYHANRDMWEFVFDGQGQLAEITDKKCDETGKNLLREGDSLERAIECYGTDYHKYDLGWDYYILEYEEADYNFRIGCYDDSWGCVRFTKCLKEMPKPSGTREQSDQLAQYSADWPEERLIEELEKRGKYREQCTYYSEWMDYMENVREVRDISMYIDPLYATDSNAYSREDFEGVPPLILHLAKNEIYARHGYIFRDSDLNNYFMMQVWYLPRVASGEFDDSVFNGIEKHNLEILKELDAN